MCQQVKMRNFIYMRDEFCWQYTAEKLEMCDVAGMEPCGFVRKFKSQFNEVRIPCGKNFLSLNLKSQ
jgi:hypothetical protein